MKAVREKTAAPTSLRVMNGFVWLAFALLGASTAATLIFLIGKGWIGGGNIYSTGYTGDVVIEHIPPVGEKIISDPSEGLRRAYPRFLSAEVQTIVHGAGPRLVLVVAAVVDLALAWFALINVQRLTHSSMQGDVFTNDNAARLSRLAWTSIAYPFLVWWIGRSWFQSLYSDDQVGVSGFLVRDGVDNWAAWLGVGLLLHTIARAFRWGVELQELEAATI